MSGNPYLRRQSKADGNRVEELAARRAGGRSHVGSGNKSEKADFTVGQFKVEVKATAKDSMKMPLDWLLKVAQEALEEGKDPAMMIQFIGSTQNLRGNGSWVMIPERVFLEMVREDS